MKLKCPWKSDSSDFDAFRRNRAAVRAPPRRAVRVRGGVFPPLSGLGFVAQGHASPRLAPYSPGAEGIPAEWYGRRRRRPRTRRRASPL